MYVGSYSYTLGVTFVFLLRVVILPYRYMNCLTCTSSYCRVLFITARQLIKVFCGNNNKVIMNSSVEECVLVI